MGTERVEKERAEEKKQEEKELLFLFPSKGGRRRRVSGHVRPQYGCGCVPQPNCGHPDEEVVVTPTWGEFNLPAALLDLVTCGGPRLHSAALVVTIYMLYTGKAMMLLSVFQKRPPCKYSHLNIRIPLH